MTALIGSEHGGAAQQWQWQGEGQVDRGARRRSSAVSRRLNASLARSRMESSNGIVQVAACKLVHDLGTVGGRKFYPVGAVRGRHGQVRGLNAGQGHMPGASVLAMRVFVDEM